MIDRRSILTGSAGLAAAGATAVVPANGTAIAAHPASQTDLRQFGVEPDAPRDQSAALQRTIDEAVRTSGQLFLPAGTYVAAGLEINGPLSLAGVPGRTRIIAPAGKSLLFVSDASDTCLTGLVLDGAGQAPQGIGDALITVHNCPGFTMENCQIVNSAGNGLAINGCTGHLRHNTISGIRGAAIHAVDNQGLRISANHIHDCRDNGILVWQSTQRHDASVVTGNQIERIGAQSGGSGQYGNGINVFRAGGVIVSANTITDCAYSAVRNNAGANVQIVNNNCARLGEVALFAEFAFNGAVISGNIVDSAAIGISITNFASGGRLAVCSGNIITNLNQRPPLHTRNPGIAVEADTVVTGNVVENTPDYAFALGWGPYARNISATGNIARNCRYGFAASVTPGARQILVASNIISNATGAAIVGMDHDQAVTGDLTLAGARQPDNVAIAGNTIT